MNFFWIVLSKCWKVFENIFTLRIKSFRLSDGTKDSHQVWSQHLLKPTIVGFYITIFIIIEGADGKIAHHFRSISKSLVKDATTILALSCIQFSVSCLIAASMMGYHILLAKCVQRVSDRFVVSDFFCFLEELLSC